MGTKERLIEYLNHKKVSKSAFCTSIGVSHAYITSMRKSIQPDKLEKISEYYPDLNINWLMTGEGEMIKSEKQEITLKSESSVFDSLRDTIENLKEMVRSQNEIIRCQNEFMKELREEMDRMRKNDAHPDDGVSGADVG